MEYANIEIRLAGSLLNTVKKEVSAPEIVVLRQIHGLDGVANVVKTRVDQASGSEERDRLNKVYNPEVVEKLFPGALGRIPTTLVEVGAEEPVVEAPAKKAK